MGVAQFEDDGAVTCNEGDGVLVLLDGIDEDRGQLKMSLIKKLAP